MPEYSATSKNAAVAAAAAPSLRRSPAQSRAADGALTPAAAVGAAPGRAA